MTEKEKIAAIAFFSNLVDHDADARGYANEIPLFKTALEALESPRGWTPCAEGLPDTNGDVYITCEYRGKLIAAVGFMGHSGAWYILADDDGNEAKVNALAWQPLPAPWSGEVKEE